MVIINNKAGGGGRLRTLQRAVSPVLNSPAPTADRCISDMPAEPTWPSYNSAPPFTGERAASGVARPVVDALDERGVDRGNCRLE